MSGYPFTRVIVALLLTLGGVIGTPAPATAQTMPPAAGPVFLPDGAHLAPGVVLRLAALGRGDALAPVDAVPPTDDGTRAAYIHGNATEWYVRQSAGVEQGITLAAPPAGDGPLALIIATPGAAVLVNEAGDSASLILPDKTQWRYDGLHVTDATGRVLPSRLVQAATGGIGITADDAGAVYPVTVDPFIAAQTLNDPGATNLDGFGIAVSLSTDGVTLAVGTQGTQSRVYLYTRNAGSYVPLITLNDPAATNGDGFGSVVSLSADSSTLAVSAYSSSSTQGKVYVYARSGNVYVPLITLNDPAATNGDSFGNALSLSADGSALAVGANGTSSSQGRVYVYVQSGGTYVSIATLSEPFPSADGFGYTLALSADGSTLAVGVPAASSQQGLTYVFTHSGSNYVVLARLTDPATTNYDDFGIAVALNANGSVLAVSGGSIRGTTYVFTRNAGNYGTMPQVLSAIDPNSTIAFGAALSLSGDGNTLVISANSTIGTPGMAYVFTRSGGSYTLATTFSAPTATSGDYFSRALALSADGSSLAVGAFGTNSYQGKVYAYTNGPVASALTLTGFSPPSGSIHGGTTVTILGTNLTGTTRVSFGGTDAAIAANTDTILTVIAPAHTAGTVDITVTAGGQAATLHGYVYLDNGDIAPQPQTSMHPAPTSGSGMTVPIVQPGRHDPPTGGGGTGIPTPAAQPGRH